MLTSYSLQKDINGEDRDRASLSWLISDVSLISTPIYFHLIKRLLSSSFHSAVSITTFISVYFLTFQFTSSFRPRWLSLKSFMTLLLCCVVKSQLGLTEWNPWMSFFLHLLTLFCSLITDRDVFFLLLILPLHSNKLVTFCLKLKTTYGFTARESKYCVPSL